MFNATVAASIVAALSGAVDIGALAQNVNFGPQVNFANGSGANQAQKLFADNRALAASGSESLDLASGVSDAFGQTLTFTKVKALLIRAAAANVNDVVVGGAAANGFSAPFGDPTDKVKVKPGGWLLLVAPDANGYAVAAGTGDLLQVANSGAGTGVTYDVIVIGV